MRCVKIGIRVVLDVEILLFEEAACLVLLLHLGCLHDIGLLVVFLDGDHLEDLDLVMFIGLSGVLLE